MAGFQASTAAAQTRPDDKTLADSYVYLLGRGLVIRQEHLDAKAPGFAYNQIKYNPLGSADFVNPNFDVAYLEAWFAVDDHTPVILEVPKVEGRYYTAQLLDEWGEVIANINERAFPSRPYGKFALVKPGSRPQLPPDVVPIALHSSKAKFLGRVEIQGDPEGALKLQKQFRVHSAGTPSIAPPPDMPEFDNNALISAALFDHLEERLGSALDVAPNAARMQQQARSIAAYIASGKAARDDIDARLVQVVRAFETYALTKSAPNRNHWVGGAAAGNYLGNYWLRTSVNYAGIWANTADEVLYFVATKDSEERPLDGSQQYVMHFPADRLPDAVVDAYWSVILVGVPDYRVVPNALQRYNFNNHSALQKEADGSLKIGVGPQPPAGVPQSNWIPSAQGKPFSLTFRTYVPKDSVIRGDWQPVPVARVP